ncbi:5-formyltetrahydrofolate cyclo-ligase [Jonesia denitrificans]|uniref:5-formyltetrahydrofolate cyclo-ligase n=1 Tax=Jonesia denitrificans (strain ATCC 14870 / DSM 20603 / BCRC 15368 / CIP 55.134 / JCM 11481 / NBRC 15587 / NCTC 10816 / Prevot 55134) TaxID=471856 RepID=C7R0E4_JONDD|nr:5-formyltetrahydrofolate cyclo-ligase [Jonesia denitrificans]ACV09608.1 5-formyltetrahydrofolate cyclo-ligase [Jonesia denitrificans DSM 20603]ASE09168.1 5-formyltetrahydrofolate cyclo-ligase [Jonesia denitrificans]QXB43712.1 5-formyltetrahydrofolate cyclo-ligase [Jonesia denitrificans]SQH22073.1 5-formyltetrahydrofolate cyclo-ligase family protein [Jonesia denitrificans]
MSGMKQPYPIDTRFEIEDAKAALRSAIRSNREARSERLRQEAGADFAKTLLTVPQIRAAKTLALYASRPGEPDTGPALDALTHVGKRIILPVLGAGLTRDWAVYRGAEDLQQRAPGRPPEPSGDPLGPEALAQADVIIAPALAVDSAGLRLGQGGGWYDRALVHARADARTIALVYPEELYDAQERPLPREDHDQLVDGVATTTSWQWLAHSGL